MTENTTPTFRDRPLIMDDSGKRRWVYAKKPKGKWYNRRTVVGWLMLMFLVLAPVVKINGNPLMMFDVANRRFYLFSAMFFSQDTYLLAIIMAITVVSIVLFTVAFGRIWCGWACPQTVFLEMVFRRIEYLFDGSHTKKSERKDKGSLTFRTVTKHLVFFLVALFFTNAFMMWFIGTEGLSALYHESISANLNSFLLMFAIAGIYYWIYAFFREQVCTLVCPYGRMQGVLVDKKTVSVMYDYKRGEPRGAKKQGDCIDCHACISVCPTGIDIKNGSQLECINCTACIDECDSVMQRIGKPRGLVRYTSAYSIETGKSSWLNSRTIAYSGVLILMFSFLIFTVNRRTPVQSTILRMPGTLYQQVSDKVVSNIYKATVVNKTNEAKALEFKLIDFDGAEVEMAGQDVVVTVGGSFEGVLIVKIDPANLKAKSTDIVIGAYCNGKLLEATEINFIGPAKQ